jgi:hypothetical protein
LHYLITTDIAFKKITHWKGVYHLFFSNNSYFSNCIDYFASKKNCGVWPKTRIVTREEASSAKREHPKQPAIAKQMLSKLARTNP